MKKNGKGSFLTALWWLLGCLCLGVLLMLLAPRESRVSETEKRMLAGFPELNEQTLMSGAFFAGIEDYLSDGFFGREQVVDWTDEALALFDKRTEEQRQLQDEAEINRLLTADAQGTDEYAAEEEPAAEETPGITAAPVPTAVATPVPTQTPTPVPSAAPTPAPTAAMAQTPAAAETAAPTASPTAAPTLTPEPTATPKVIVPLAGNEMYTLELVGREEKNTLVYEYPAENLLTFANTLNYLRDLLPENGEVHYLQVPVAQVGRRLTSRMSPYSGWVSTMEDALETQVKDGVSIHNAPAILNEALGRREAVYYYTDHHWTPLGAWYAVESIMHKRGYPALPYEEYAYFSRLMDTDKNGREDWLHLLEPLAPTHSYILTHLTESREIDFMNPKNKTYVAYINNTQTPWRRFTGGFGSERRALLISDSFGNVFLPYLLPYYGEVHMTDLRNTYYQEEEAGGTFAQLLRYHEVDDVYIVLSTANGINSKNSLQVFYDTISK